MKTSTKPKQDTAPVIVYVAIYKDGPAQHVMGVYSRRDLAEGLSSSVVIEEFELDT